MKIDGSKTYLMPHFGILLFCDMRLSTWGGAALSGKTHRSNNVEPAQKLELLPQLYVVRFDVDLLDIFRAANSLTLLAGYTYYCTAATAIVSRGKKQDISMVALRLMRYAILFTHRV